jgi:hypothetical protein
MKLADTVAIALVIAIIFLLYSRRSSGLQECAKNENTGSQLQIVTSADCSKMTGGKFTTDVTTGAQAGKKFCCNSA